MSSFPHDREATPDPVADIERGLSSLALKPHEPELTGVVVVLEPKH
jgi:hypothetical protein